MIEWKIWNKKIIQFIILISRYESKLEALSEAVQKKSICRKIPRRYQYILSKTSIEWSLLVESINVEYCSIFSVSTRTLQISLSPLFLFLSLFLYFPLSFSLSLSLCLKIRLPYHIRKTRIVWLRNVVKYF